MEILIGKILISVAGILWGLEMLPQIYKTWKTKTVSDFSPFFLILCWVAYVLFMIGCILTKAYFYFYAHLLPMINITILDTLYFIYRKNSIDYSNLPHFIINGVCCNWGAYICNLGYACDGCPFNKDEIKSEKR